MKLKLAFLCMATLVVTLSNANDKAFFPKVKGWKTADKIDVYTPENLWDKINGAADGYFTYEFKKLLVTDYTRKNGDYISVEIYEHSTPVMAFGIYSSERPSDGRYNKNGTQGYELDGLFHFLADRYYVKISTPLQDEDSKRAMRDIAKGIATRIGGNQSFPLAVQCFPIENLKTNSTIYVSKNFMGYGFLNSAFVSSYNTNDSNYTVFIIEATNQEAAQKMISEYFKLQKVSADDLTEGKIIVPDLFNGNIPLMWENNLIWGIQNGTKIQEPFELLNQIKNNLKTHKLIH